MAEQRAPAAADAARDGDRGGAVAARRSAARDRAAAAVEVVDDELQRRIRSLEAERLRPVPGPPVGSKRLTTESERAAARRDFATVEAIRELISATHGDENDDEEAES